MYILVTVRRQDVDWDDPQISGTLATVGIKLGLPQCQSLLAVLDHA